MDKIVVLVLLIAVTLGLFSHSILGQAANAREFVDFADEEQTRVRILMTNPDVVTGETVLKYASREDIGIGILDTDGNSVQEANINQAGYYEMERRYENGIMNYILFTEIAF